MELRDAFLELLQAEGQTLGAAMPITEWETAGEPYWAALGHMPLECVEKAFAAWRSGEGDKNPLWAEIFPRPEQLLRLAEPFWLQVRAQAYRDRREREKPRQWTDEERRAERQKMIDAGYLNPDGTPNMTGLGPRTMPQERKPSRSPQEVAEELRRSDAQARHGGAPISRRHTEPADPGDVV